MAFNGTFELQSQENFEAFGKAIGIPDDLIEKGKNVKSVTEIVQNGDHFVVTDLGSNVTSSLLDRRQKWKLFPLKKIKTTVNLVDGKLVVKLKDITSVTEVAGDLHINVLTVKDIVYKRISKRV
ncbi:unnamed protein product [Ranitomeya imitator]|uniref:Uncharacterized protein n=1 Tax=Ranitomeya imitator TaxID=111125 RepID=A0ABN9LGE6_9NEOB|nr:unnamed protein product [Ranitomeya imitator]